MSRVQAFTTVRFEPLEGASILQLSNGEEDEELERQRDSKPDVAAKATKKRVTAKP